jgi:hypothetical protein
VAALGQKKSPSDGLLIDPKSGHLIFGGLTQNAIYAWDTAKVKCCFAGAPVCEPVNQCCGTRSGNCNALTKLVSVPWSTAFQQREPEGPSAEC